jgi:hypothetical protein
MVAVWRRRASGRLDGGAMRGAEQRLELGEGALYRRVGRYRGEGRAWAHDRLGDLVGREVVHDDHISGRKLGHQHLFDIKGRHHAWDRRAPSTLRIRKPAVNVVVFQWPWGMAARHRWPRGALP